MTGLTGTDAVFSSRPSGQCPNDRTGDPSVRGVSVRPVIHGRTQRS